MAATSSPVDAILTAIHARKPVPWLVAVAGIPGAGKSTAAAALHERMPGSVVVPMDGYHIPRSRLSAEQALRRGAPDTFDADALRSDLMSLRASRTGRFPTFDHAVKDPQPGAIVVSPGATMVFVEGLYLLLSSWRLQPLFDFTLFLDCEIATAMDRVAARHRACGLAGTLEEARLRVERNDRRNAERILADGCRARADFVVSTSDDSPVPAAVSPADSVRPT